MDIGEINRRVIEQFRAGGEVTGMRREGLVLLTTRGRRSGLPRTVPMMFHRDGDHLLVIASNAGARRHPEWYLNVAAEPRVRVEVGDDSYDAIARPLEGEDLAAAWKTIKETYPFFAEHEVRANRVIPVVALIRA